MTRIIDKIIARRKKRRNELKKRTSQNTPSSSPTSNNPPATVTSPQWFYSFEFFPPKTEAGVENLQVRIDRMVQRLSPLFIDVTWGACGSTMEKTLNLASYAQKYCGVDVLMHLTCTGMSKRDLKFALERAKACGVENILALRGDPPSNKQQQGGVLSNIKPGGQDEEDCCKYAVDLVRLIRQHYGNEFGIAVAGHPEGHALSTSPEMEMRHLKEKVDAGADFILTQFFYDTSVFIDYVKRCREFGITCPIVPGIMPIPNYSSFCVMTEVCETKVPPEMMQRLEPVKGDDEAVKDIGCEIAVDMCRDILSCDEIDVDGVHFYTLNLERSVGRIVSDLNTNVSEYGRQFPWKPSAIQKRNDTEQVRPINWANRPKSYVMRTDDWDEFPNGRWGDSTSPAFGELINLSLYYYSKNTYDEQLRASLGDHPVTVQDVRNVFANYVLGKIPHLPWCETSNIQPETSVIQKQLAQINQLGFLTINSQPPVNGLPSSDPIYGWGGNDGFVYQKAYCEMFVNPKQTQLLQKMVEQNPTMNIYAVNHDKSERIFPEEGGVTALTWGVFPNREILQPTIFDPVTFIDVWSEEAFGLWTTMWLNLYEDESVSYDLIQKIRDEYFLVAIIDNNFMNKNQLWEKLLEVGQIAGSD